jgi:hypothetical protein
VAPDLSAKKRLNKCFKMLPPGSNAPGNSFGFHERNSADHYLKLNQKSRLIGRECRVFLFQPVARQVRHALRPNAMSRRE